LSTYRIVFNALEESIEWSRQITSAPKLDFEPGARGQILAAAGANLQPRTSFNFHVRPAETGQVAVPAFTTVVYGKTVTVPAATLTVTSSPPPHAPPLRLKLEVPMTNLYVGQAIRIGILFPGTPAVVVQGQAPVQVVGQGFIIDQSSFRARTEMKPVGSGVSRGPNLIYDVSLIPLAAGQLRAFAQSFVINRVPGPAIITGPGMINGLQPVYTLLDSDAVALRVKPLPKEGELPGFTGAVGRFEVFGAPELSTTSTRVGEPIRLRIRIRGDVNSNLARLVPPSPPRDSNWQVILATDEGAVPQVIQAQGYTSFNYILIPLMEGSQTTPAIPFCSFDPALELYQDLTIPSIPVTVMPGAAPADLTALAQAEALQPEPEKALTLSGLASKAGMTAASLVPLQRQVWFPLLQLAPATALLGLWGWDRRRRFLEQHPEVVLRQRARRALHRERRNLQRAQKSRDAAGFAISAVRAMQAVCAPHYPAEPGALVSQDVLAVLTEDERAGRPGEIIRRFFQVEDAVRFATAGADPAELLSLHAELDQTLEILAAKL